MDAMAMPGGWTMAGSMSWLPACGQTWIGAAASFLGMWTVMMAAMMLPSLLPMLARYRRSVGRAGAFSSALLTIPVAVILLAAYVLITVRNLRIHREEDVRSPRESAWTMRRALVLLSLATVVTALISETLVHSLDAFGKAVGLNEFFISAVIVAIVGNAAEHGGAVVIAHRGNMRLASEIAISSSMQVAVLVTPAVALLSWLVGSSLPLAFRPIEIATMVIAATFATAMIWDGKSRQVEGFALVGVYAVIVVAYYFA